MKETHLIEHGDFLIVDGYRGHVHINPTPELVKQYESEQIDKEEEMKKWRGFVDKPTMTKDGYQITLAANMVSSNEGQNVFI